MKKLYSFTLILFVSFSLFAQTTLSPGDLVITSIIGDNPDSHQFIPLVDLDAGTVIYFTETGWNATLGAWRNDDLTEGCLTYTASAAVPAGTVITWNNDSPPASMALNDYGNSWLISGSGDSIIAFQDTPPDTWDSANDTNPFPSPNFLYVVSSNSDTWHDATSTSTCAIPPGLTEGTTAVAVGAGSGASDEYDNAYYDAVTYPLDGLSKSQILANVGDPSKWVGNNSRPTGWEITNISLSSKFLDIEGLSLYPNPVNGVTKILNVISSSKETMNINIYDLLGKNVVSGQVINEKVDLSNLNPGVYIAKLNQGDRQSSKRIIVK
jgi:hypothetical protein